MDSSLLARPTEAITTRRWFFLLLCFLTVTCFAIYSGSFSHQWTYDDFPVIVNNPDVTSLRQFFADSYHGRPLREFTFLLDYLLFGFEPAGWHIQNVLWHAVNAFLVSVTAFSLGLSRTGSLLAALFFLVHPLQVEVVSSISHRKDSLALCCELSAFLSYIKFFRSNRRMRWLFISLGLYGLSIQAKETAIVLPLLLVSYEWLFVSSEQRVLSKKLVLIPVTVTSLGGIIIYWQNVLGGIVPFTKLAKINLIKMNYFEPFDFTTYILMLLKSWAFSFSKVLLPTSLALEYIFSPPLSLINLWVLWTIAGLLGLVWFVIRYRRQAPLVSFCLIWVFCFWLLIANLFWPGAYFAADRYLYAPLVGISILVAWSVDQLFRCQTKRWVTIIYFALLMTWSWMSFEQDKVWASSLTLWENAVQVNPTAPIALHGLALAYQEKKVYDKAITFYLRALANPCNSQSHLNLGNLYFEIGNHVLAIKHYELFIEKNNPDHPQQVAATRQFLKERYGIIR